MKMRFNLLSNNIVVTSMDVIVFFLHLHLLFVCASLTAV